MSRITALVTVLVLGSSAAAMASPARSYDGRRDEPGHLERNGGSSYLERSRIERSRIERSRIERSRIERSRMPSYVERTRIERTRIDPRPVERTPERFVRLDDRDRSWRRGVARDDFGPRRYRPTWTALSAPLALARGGRGCVEVADPGTFTQLRLQTEGGIAQIDRVVIEFADGSDQVAYPERVLDDRGDLLEIPLDGNNRQIDRILVTGATRGGAVEVFAI